MKKTNTRGSTTGWFNTALAFAAGAAESKDDQPSSSQDENSQLPEWYTNPTENQPRHSEQQGGAS